MALNFPDNPSVNDVYRDSVSGFAYQWDGVVWKSYSDSSLGQIKIIDDISGSFNGSTQTFALTSSSFPITPVNAQQIRVVLGGVVQDPADDYTVSGSNITFTVAPISGLSFSAVIFGTAVPISTILDGTVTPSKLSTGGPTWNVSGDLNVVGILTANRARVTGVVTASSFVGNITGTAGTIATLNSTNATITNLNSSGIVTATSLRVGTGVTIDGNSGIISATQVYSGGVLTIGTGKAIAMTIVFG